MLKLVIVSTVVVQQLALKQNLPIKVVPDITTGGNEPVPLHMPRKIKSHLGLAVDRLIKRNLNNRKFGRGVVIDPDGEDLMHERYLGIRRGRSVILILTWLLC